MNKIYKVVWSKARNCYVVGSELMKTHQGKKSSQSKSGVLSKAAWALFWGIAGWGAACNFIYADVTVADAGKYGNTVATKELANHGKQYDINNQQVSGKNALNKFNDFGIGKNDVANMHLDGPNGNVDHQINLVKNRIDIDGVVNAIKNNKIGGDVYFFSDKGIAVGANGVFNVGRLTLGTNATYGESLFNGGMEAHLKKSALEQAQAISGGDTISLKGKIYAQGDVVLGAGSISLEGGEIRSHWNNQNVYGSGTSADSYRNQLVNIKTPSATVAKELGNGDIVLSAVGRDTKAFATEGAISIKDAYVDAGSGNTTMQATAERNIGNLWSGKVKAGVDVVSSTIKGKDLSIAAETKISGQVGTVDAYKNGDAEGGIFGVLNSFIGEQVGDLASVVQTKADSHVMIRDSNLQATHDLTISSTAESAIGSETGGSLGLGINVGVSDVNSQVDIQGKSTLDAGNHLKLSAEGNNSIGLIRQSEAETVPISVDLGWAEAHTDVGVSVEKDATLGSQGDVTVSSKATRALSVEVDNSSSDGTLGLAAGVIQSETKAHTDVQGNIFANGDVSISAENTVVDEKGDINPDSLHVTSESGSDEESGTLETIIDVAQTKGKGNQLMAGIKALMSDKSKEKKAADEGTSASDQASATEAGGGLGLNAATSFLFSDNQAKASLSGKVRAYDETDGAGSLSISANTVSRTQVKSGVSQGADKSVGIAAAVNYVDQNDNAEAELAGNIKTKGEVSVTAETKRPWESGLESLGEDPIEDLKTIFDPNNGFELSYLTDSWTQTGGAGEKVSGAAALNIMEYNHTAKATIKNGTTIETDGDVTVNAVNDTNTINFSGDIKAPIGDQPGSLDFWKDIKESPFSGGGKVALGGAALTVHQKNTAEATIEDQVTITKSKDVTVNAENKGFNLSMAAAGGKGGSVAIDGTVNVDRFENTTKATVGKGTISSGGDVNVNAEDKTKNINIGGAIAVSEGTGIGATIAYNHIDRNTEAALLGTIQKAGNVSVTAQNTGAIYAMSAAGGVTMNSITSNGGGSTGLHKQEGGSGDSTSSIGDLANSLLNAGKSDKNKKNMENGDSAISSVAGKDASMSGNVGTAKGGFAAAANVSVNRITDTAKAYTKGSTITANSLSVKSGNTSQILTGAGAIALGLSQNSSAIAGSFMYNAITDRNEAYVEDSTLTLKGNQEENKEESLTIEANNAAKITNIAASGSGAAKGSAVAGQISLNWVDNATDAHVKNSTIRAGEAIRIAANDKGTIDSYTGAVAFAGGGNGAAVGAAIAVNLIQGNTTAYLEHTEVTGLSGNDKSGKLDVTAEEASEISSIVASGGVADGLAAAFSASGNWISTTTDAHISNNQTMKTGALSIGAKNHSNATIGVGNAAIGNNAAGASIGVMVNDSTVNASLTGDETKQKTIEANGISITADNQYNGDANDLDSDSKAKTVAIGFAGGASQFAGSGSVTVNVINQKTDTTLGKGKYDAGNGKVNVEATSGAKLFGMAGGLALSGGSGIGAAVDVQTYNGHTYAGIKDGAKLSHAKAVKVNANSVENMTSVAATLAGGAGAFAGAGAAGAHSISTDTKAYIGEEGNTDKAELMDAGDVSINASDTTKLTTAAGSGAASGNTGVGLTAAVEVIHKKANASVGNQAIINGNSLMVRAENTSSSTTAAAGLGAGGTAGIAGAASETFVTQETNASVGKKAKVTTTDGVNIQAVSTFTQGAGAGSVGAGGTVGMGLSNSTVSLKATTKAYADEGAVISGGKKVHLSADHTSDLTYATIAGGVGGTVGVSGAVGVNILDTETKAYAGENSELSADSTTANEGISISATDETKLHGGNGGTAIGATGGGAGAAVAVTNIKKDTAAYVDKNAKLDSKDQISLDAQNTEDILNISLQASGGTYAGLAGAVNVVNLEAITKAYTNTGVQINQKAKDGGSISIKADHEIKQMDNSVVGAAVSGGASIGAAVDVVNIKTQTNAYLGDQNLVDTHGNVTIEATDNMHDIASRAYAASVGLAGLSGSISIYNIGSTISDEDKKNLTGKTAEDGSETDFDSWVNSQLNQSSTKKAMSAYDSGALYDVKDQLEKADYKTEAPSTTGEKGTLAKIGNGTIIHAGGDVTVKADDKLQMTNTMGNADVSGVVSAGASVSVVNTNTQTKALIDTAAKITSGGKLNVNAKADHSMTNWITGASISGGVAVQGTVQTWHDTSNVYALIGATKGIKAKDISVTSDNQRKLNSNLIGASVALAGAVNGAVITATADGESMAGIGDETNTNVSSEGVKATEGNITISSNADTMLDAMATGAAAGIFAGTGTGVDLTSGTAVKSFVGKGETLSAAKDMSITATNTPKLSAMATSAGVGIAGVGTTVAKVTSNDSALVAVGDGASLDAKGALRLQAKMAKPAKGYNALAHAIAGGGGVVAGAVSVVDVNMNHNTDVSIGGGVTIQAKKADISAIHQDSSYMEMESVAAGSYSGTGGNTSYTETSNVNVTIGDGTAITTDDETSIQADNQTEKSQKVISGGAALASGNGIVSDTTITHHTKANIGKVTLKANASELTEAEKAAGKTIHDKNAISIDAHSNVISSDDNTLTTGSVVGAAHVKSNHTVNATTEASVAEGAILLAGDTEKIKGEYTNDFTQAGTIRGNYRGGSIGIGSRNDASISAKTLVDVFGAAGYAGSENNVTYNGKTKTTFDGSAETAKGDIRVAAGRDSQGEAGSITATAKSDILNATAIPISVKKDPYAKIVSVADLVIGGTLLSDRDIYLQSNAGNTKATGQGEVKDWVNKVAEAFGSEGGSIGKSSVDGSANASIRGKAETGIHRNKTIIIGGHDENGTWKTSVTTKGDISYSVSGTKAASETLSKRLEELHKELADHASDPAAKASYEAEIAFIQAKMVEQGLGYVDAEGHFYEIDAGTSTELSDAETMLKGMTDSKDQVKNAIKKDQTAVKEVQDAMEAMGTKHTAYTNAQQAERNAAQEKNNAEVSFKTAETVLKEKMGNNPSQEQLDAYVKDESHSQEAEVLAYTKALTSYQDAEKNLQETQSATSQAKLDYENQVKAAGYDPAHLDEKKIQEDWNSLAALQKTYQDSANTIDSEIQNLNDQIAATKDFFEKHKGTEKDGKFYYADGSEVTDGKWNGQSLLHTKAYPHLTRDVTIEDTVSQLGDIYLEGSNITGGGTLTAHGDAQVDIINNSPNNLVVGDVQVIGKVSNGQIGQGGAFYWNGNALKSGETVGDLKLTGRNQTEDPTVSISSTFNPTDSKYLKDGAPLYSAPNLTLGKGKTIYNSRGKVSITSDYGDVYNEGGIVAGSVELTAKNGDFIQSYSNRIANIGGDPFVKDGKDSFKKNDNLGSGILANGNIFISARYVNINSKIQSGIADWSLEIPEDLTFYYMKDGKTKTMISAEEAKTLGKNYTIYVGNAKGNISDHLTYDAETGHLVVSGVEVHGGKVSIVGTVINTTKDTSKARIEALDGYGNITIDNKSKYDLELKGLNTGEGVEGVIEITDLNTTDGTPVRKTTYTRENGHIQMTVQDYQKDGTWSAGKNEAFDGTYKPAEDQHYVFQTGTDSSTTNTYEYHGEKFDWWGIQNKTPSRDELIAMGAKLTSTIKGEEKELTNGTFISKSTTGSNGIGDGKTKSWKVNNKSEVIDYTIKTKRKWYTLGLTKKYDMKMVTRDYDTTIKQYETGASHAIGIGFNGNETGGTIDINRNGGQGNVLISGTISNTKGTTNISGSSITQNKNGFLNTGTLQMDAVQDVGSQDQSILTNATTISGSAKEGSFFVKSSGSDVSVGTIEAAKKISLAVDGGMKQKESATMKASRIELSAGTGGITGVAGTFSIEAGQESGNAYGLKASADGDISITNTGGDLYLDSVISKSGDVSLTTDGSFIDNNFADVTDETARAKLLAWADAAVLEGKDSTIKKQKDLLIAKVQDKYNDYQALSRNVKDGKYILSDTEKDILLKQGMDLDSYVAGKQARYDALVKDGVNSWTAQEVTNYINGIQNDTSSSLYGNAALTKDSLSADKFLTADEKANILVGSAKSAKDLLITFAPGGIKEGITDTNANIKGTPHVSGKNVSLIAKGGNVEDGKKISGIGQKKTGLTIDLSKDLNTLTAEELLALSSAERGDFKRSGDTVTVSTIRSIDAEAKGKLIAKAENGSIYLVSEGNINKDSEFKAGGEIRLKAAGNVSDMTIGSNDQTVLESGEGAISGVKVTGNGVLTARAKNGVSLSKEDGDLIINTIYASEGDVTIDLANKGRLTAEKDQEESEKLHIEGENITIENATSIGDDNSIGMKVTGKADQAGSIIANVTDTAKVTLFGELKEDTKTSISGKNTSITNRGQMAGGHFTGQDVTIDNREIISGGLMKADVSLTITNSGTIRAGDFESGTVGITNTGLVSGGTYTAKTGDLSYEDTALGSMSGGQFIAEAGNVYVTAHGTLAADAIQAKEEAKVTSDGDATLTQVEAGTITIHADGSVIGNTWTSTAGDVNIDAGNISIDTLKSSRNLTMNAAGALSGTTMNVAQNADLTSGKLLKVDRLTAGEEAKLSSDSDVELNVVRAGEMTLDAKGNIHGTNLSSTKGDVSIDAGNDISVDTLKSARNLRMNAAGALNGNTIDVAQNADLTSGELLKVDQLTAGEEAKLSSDSDVELNVVNAGEIVIDAKGNIHGTDFTSTKGDVNIKAGQNVSVDKLSSARNLTMNAAGTLKGTTIDVAQNANLTSGKLLKVDQLTAGEEAKLSSDSDVELNVVNAGEVVIDAKGAIRGVDLTSMKGDISMEAGKDISVEKLTSARNLMMNAVDSVTGTTITATKNAILTSGTTMTVKDLQAEEEAKISGGGDVTLTTVKAGEIDAESKAGSLSGTTLKSTKGDAKLKAKQDVSVGTMIAKNNLTMEATDGQLEAELVKAGKNALLTSGATMTIKDLQAEEEAKISGGGDVTLTTVKAGEIDAESKAGSLNGTTLESTKGDAKLKAKQNVSAVTITAKNNLTMEATDGQLEATIVKAGKNATLTSGATMTINDLQAEEEAKISGGGDVTLTTVKAGEIHAESTAGSLSGTTWTSTAGDVTIKAGKDMDVTTISSANNLVMNAGGQLTADAISANGNAGLTSHDSMIIGQLTTTGEKGDATLTSETGDVDVSISDIEKTLTINAKKNVRLSQSKSVSLKVTAEDGNIEATTKDASISSGDIDLVAGDTIRISDNTPVNKLDGVDTTEPAGTVDGSGIAGSLISGEGKGHDFDVSQKGGASLVSSTGNIKMKAGTVEADTIQVGTSGKTQTPAGLTISADHIGIDDLQSDASRVDVKVTGKDGQTQSRYAGIHTTSDGDVILKDSQVEHLDFTGKDRIGMENTSIGGDSVMATEKVTIKIGKNPSRPSAELFQDLFVDGLDIRSDKRFTDIRNGLTINGERFPETADSVARKSLYGNDYLGKDGKVKEERDGQDAHREILFAPITEREAFQRVK